MYRRCALLLVCLMTMLLCVGTALAARETIVIGVIPEQNLIRQMERYTPLCSYLGMKIGIPVEVRPVASYSRIYEKMRDGEIDAGFFGSFVYVMTRARIGIEPVARPLSLQGVSTYNGVTFVRKDSGIKKPADMRGKTIALVDPATTAGCIAPKDYLREHGIDIDRDLRIIWKDSHDSVIAAVMQGQAQIGAAKNTFVQHFRRTNRIFDERIIVMDERPKIPVPDNALAVRGDMDPVVRRKIARALLNMHRDDVGKTVLASFGAARFVETRNSDYKSLYDLVKRMKIDLEHYSYQDR